MKYDSFQTLILSGDCLIKTLILYSFTHSFMRSTLINLLPSDICPETYDRNKDTQKTQFLPLTGFQLQGDKQN